MRSEPEERLSTEVLVIGSGAGGATVAATLAEAGRSVLVLEEGPDADGRALATNGPEAMQTLYRNAGLSPILGRSSIAFVEGCCVGGSTEINSAFWCRLPPAIAERWRAERGLDDFGPEQIEEAFAELEESLGVGVHGAREVPPSSRVFRDGCRRLGMPAAETPRAQEGDLGASQFGPRAKRSMSRTWIPRARRAGARVLDRCYVRALEHAGGRATGVRAVRETPEGRRAIRVDAESVFLCAGAVQTPALLRASGIRRNVGDSLRIHPMLKLAAEFDEVLDSHRSVIPYYQVRRPEVFLGGSVFTPGFLALTLFEQSPENEEALSAWRRMALYYAGCVGTGWGKVRVLPGWREPLVRCGVPARDRENLRGGLLQLCEILFAGGARRIYPALRGVAPFDSMDDARAVLSEELPASRMSLSTVHVTSSCPMGADPAVSACGVDGRLVGFENVHVADASVLPEAPGVNPQATVMAFALRNARRFLAAAA